MAAAVIGAVLVLVVPLLARLGGDQAPTASNRLAVPYSLTDVETEHSTLYDGTLTVPMPPNLSRMVGRVDGGWVGTVSAPRPSGGNAQRIGVLQQDGTLRLVGPKDTQYVALSPDHKQIATTEPLGGGKTRVAAFDVASGRQVSSVTLPHRTTILYGWNKDGIWLAEDYKVGAQPSVWQPSTGRNTALTVRGYALRLVAPSDSDRVLVVVRPQAGKWCMQAARLVDGQLVVDREYCGTGDRAVYPTMSPDGGTMLYPTTNLAVDVVTGRQTTIRAPHAFEELLGPDFEDATHVIAVFRDSSPATNATPSPGRTNKFGGSLEDRSVFRCDVTDGSCAKVYDVPDGKYLRFLAP
jgi:hypothetical protein